MDRRCYAHTLPGRVEEEWQDLREHLEGVSKRAAASGAYFHAGDWARVAGLWHDLGKYSDAFQSYLRTASSPDPHIADTPSVSGRTDHSTAGAQHAAAHIDVLGHLLAYSIAGHHSGLLDGRGPGSCLEARLTKAVEPWSHAPKAIVGAPALKPPAFVATALGGRDAFSVAFFVRMVFSCLVDADFLDTERFMNPERAAARPTWPADVLERMEASLDAYMSRMKRASTPVNVERAMVREVCRAAAVRHPGLFSLTVPTGGGKTLSSLAFALRHAQRHGLRRVVYVVPFTTITEQIAEQFRNVMRPLGNGGPVVEHHSNLDAGSETTASRLATENWDAPLVVTTSVQFYDSLFAARPSRCRKLHNLAKAVIILDEAQTLPVDYLEPCLRTLRELTANYGSTTVLCTATQPAVQRRDDFRIGLDGVREIIPEPPRLYASLKRVHVEHLGKRNDASLTEDLLAHEQVLCIVNTRGHARTLSAAIGDRDQQHFHLSALMCPQHRTTVLTDIKATLKAGRICRVISTQLIECGVDIDFPTVYRSLAGVDSIAQAAGRCNRNGAQKTGRTFVFRSEHEESERYFADTANCASQVLPLHEDPLSLDAVEHYFRLYYWDQSARWDAKGILQEFHLNQDRQFPFLFGFSTVAERFHLVDDTGRPVIVPWEDAGNALCQELRVSHPVPDRTLLRKLQRYTVQVPVSLWNTHVGRQSIDLVHDRYPVLASPELHYSERTGLDLDRSLVEALVI